MKKLVFIKISLLARRVLQLWINLRATTLALMIFGTGVLACNCLFAKTSSKLLPLTSCLNAAEQFATLLACLIGAFSARKLSTTATLPNSLPANWRGILCGLASALGNEALRSTLLHHVTPPWFSLAFCLSALICATVGSCLTHRPETFPVLAKLEYLGLLTTLFSAGLTAHEIAPYFMPVQALIGAALGAIGGCGNSVLLNLMFRQRPLSGIDSSLRLALFGGAFTAMLIGFSQTSSSLVAN